MKNEIRSLLINTCGWIVTISVVVFFFTLWLYSYNNVESPLKEAWTITFSSLSALTTISAAAIACYLYNDWKEQPKLDIALEMYDTTREITKSVNKLRKLNPIHDNKIEFKDFYPIRNEIVQKIEHLLYLERKYIALKQENDFKVFKHHTNTKYNSANYLYILIGKTSSLFSDLLRCKDNESIDYWIAYKFFSTSYVITKSFRDPDGYVIPVDDIGNMINTEISNIYKDIEQLTKN